MDLNASRIGLLVPSPTPIWTGTADGAQTSGFVLTVTTSTGTLAASMAGMVLVWEGTDLVRIKSISGSDISLAENPVEFAASDSLAIYELRLPFPRYQRLDSGTVYKDYDVAFPAAYQDTQPPSVVIEPAAVWAQNGDTVTLDALKSMMMHPTDATGAVQSTTVCASGASGMVS